MMGFESWRIKDLREFSSANLLMRSEKLLNSTFFRLCVAFCKTTLTAYANKILNLARKIYYGVVCEMPQKPKRIVFLNKDSIANLSESKNFNDSTPPPAPPLKKGRGEVIFLFGLSPTDFFARQKVSKKDSCDSTQKSRHNASAKKWEQGSSSATATFLLEAEKRSSPPKSGVVCERSEAKKRSFWRVGGAGWGVQPFCEKKSCESSGEIDENFVSDSRDSQNLRESKNSKTSPHNSLQTHFTFREGESLDSYGLSPTDFFRKKVSKKTLDLGDSQSDLLPTLNPLNCDNLGDSRESHLWGFKGATPPCAKSPSARMGLINSPSHSGRGLWGWKIHKIINLCKIRVNLKVFCLLFFKKVGGGWGEAPQTLIFPPPSGRGLGGGVISKSIEFTQDSRELLLQIFSKSPCGILKSYLWQRPALSILPCGRG